MLQYLLDNGCISSNETVRIAAENGHLEVLQYLVENTEYHWDISVSTSAAYEGHLHVLQYIRGYTKSSHIFDNNDDNDLKRIQRRKNPCMWDETTCAFAAQAGQLHILQWMRSLPKEERCPWDVRTCITSAYMGHLHILQWVLQKKEENPPCDWDYETIYNCKK